MTRRSAGAAALLFLACVTTACSPEGADDAEITRWIEQRPEPPEGNLGTMSSRISPDDPAPGPDGGAMMMFDDPSWLAAVRLSCLGEGTVSFTIEVDGVTSQRQHNVGDVPCGEEHEESIDARTATSVRVAAVEADRAGAWHAVLLGPDA